MDSDVRNQTWRDRAWVDLNDKYSGVSQSEAAWLARFHDPMISLQEALGLLHCAFAEVRVSSPKVVRLLLEIASVHPDLETPLGQLSLKAQQVLLFNFLKCEEGSERFRGLWWPAVRQDPGLLGEIAQFLLDAPSLYHLMVGTGTVGSREIVGKFLWECYRYYWWEPTDSTRDQPDEVIAEALHSAVMTLTVVVRRGAFPAWLKPHREGNLSDVFVRRQITPLLKACHGLLPECADGVPDWKTVIECNDEFSQAVVRHYLQYRVRLGRQIEACKDAIDECLKNEEKAKKNFLRYFQDSTAGNHKREAYRQEERRKEWESEFVRLNEELKTIPQF